MALQKKKVHGALVNVVTADEAHLWLGLTRDGFLQLLAENPILKPVLCSKGKKEPVYHKELLVALRWSQSFRPGLAVA
jgi:hypothetical protein